MATGLFRFTPNERLHLSRDFKKIFKEGFVWHNGAITLYVLDKPPEKKPGIMARIGIVIPGKTAGAVQRNKLKRRIREIFRLNKSLFNRPVDIIIICKKGATRLNYNELEKKIISFWIKAKILDRPQNDKKQVVFG